MSDKPSLVARLSIGVREPNIVPIGQDEPKFANPYIHVQGLGHFHLLGEIPLFKARAIAEELQANLDVARSPRVDVEALRKDRNKAAGAFTSGWLACEYHLGQEAPSSTRVASEARYLTQQFAAFRSSDGGSK